MPRISRPESNIERNIALRNAKNRKDQVPPMPVIPYTPATITWLDTFQPLYKAAFDAVSEALQTQTNITAQAAHAKKLAIYYEQDFVLNLNRAIRREQFTASARTYYGIALDDDSTLKVTSENQLIDANDVLTNGEANRVADGGTPITFPSIGQVNTAVSNFVTLNNSQAPAMANFDLVQEALAAMNDEADRLILKLWNETETAFDTGDKPSMRRKCRDWGVIYKPSPGEAISPDEFSIKGKITENVTGPAVPVDEAEITVMETNTTVLSLGNGDYLVPFHPAGTYTLQVVKPGFVTNTITGVVVTTGAITTVNIQLTPTGTNGTVSGTVTQGGVGANANVSIDGFGMPVPTDGLGNYIIPDVPPGPQTVRAALASNPANFLTQNITVVAGVTSTVNFNFP